MIIPALFKEIIFALYDIIKLSLVIVFIINTYLFFTVGRRFEKLFHDLTPIISYSYLRLGSRAGRFHDYLCLIYDFANHKKDNSEWYCNYQQFDFIAHCSKFEIALVKLSYHAGDTAVTSLFAAMVILLYFQEKLESDLWHSILYACLYGALISGTITLVSYVFLKCHVFPRLNKIMRALHPEYTIYFRNYLCLIANYAYHQRKNSFLYRVLKSGDIMTHISNFERRWTQFTYWIIWVFMAFVLAILGIMFIRFVYY